MKIQSTKTISVAIASVVMTIFIAMATDNFDVEKTVNFFNLKEPYNSHVKSFFNELSNLVKSLFSTLKGLSNDIFKADSVVNKGIKSFEESSKPINIP
jgi:glutaredoxin 2